MACILDILDVSCMLRVCGTLGIIGNTRGRNRPAHLVLKTEYDTCGFFGVPRMVVIDEARMPDSAEHVYTMWHSLDILAASDL